VFDNKKMSKTGEDTAVENPRPLKRRRLAREERKLDRLIKRQDRVFRKERRQREEEFGYQRSVHELEKRLLCVEFDQRKRFLQSDIESLNRYINRVKSFTSGGSVERLLAEIKPFQQKLKEKRFQLVVREKYEYLDRLADLKVPLLLKADQWYNPFLCTTHYVRDLEHSHILYRLEYDIVYQILLSLPKRINRSLILVSKFFTHLIFRFPHLVSLQLYYF
jgi:hypothetical protein